VYWVEGLLWSQSLQIFINKGTIYNWNMMRCLIFDFDDFFLADVT